MVWKAANGVMKIQLKAQIQNLSVEREEQRKTLHRMCHHQPFEHQDITSDKQKFLRWDN